MPIRSFIQYGYLFFLLLFLLSLTGCAQKTVNNPALSGEWLITLTTHDAGRLQAVMTFEMREGDDHAFEAFSKKDMAKVILGFWKGLGAEWFTSNFKHGSLMRITKGLVIHNDSLSGVLVTPFGNYYVNAHLDNGTLSGILQDGKRMTGGQIKGTKGMPKLPLHDYHAIMDSVVAVAHRKLYDPSLLQGAEWLEFTSNMQRISRVTQDDAAFVMAFFYYGRKLPFTHFNLVHSPEDAGSDNHTVPKFVTLEEKSAATMYMKITSFSGGSREMDSSFEYIAAKGYKNLIVDLRDNPGGAVEAGIAFIRHLIPDTLYGGIFLTNKYFANHREPPAVTTYKSFPYFSDANYDLLIKGISEYSGICLKVVPQTPLYKGNVYVLINKNTASTCEPIIYGLKQQHLAMLAGERSAGAMLNGEPFGLPDGFSLFMPTATYYTSDGVKIDKSGVAPDVAVKPEAALDSVMRMVK